MSHKKIGMIGHFGGDKFLTDGQTVKTRELYKEIKKNKDFIISTLDTYNHKKNKLGLFLNCIRLLKNNDVVIIIVASGGARVIIPFLSIFNIFYHKKMCYCAIGSWVDIRVKNNKMLNYFCKKLDLILVETSELLQSLNKLNYKNVKIMYNFKEINSKCIALERDKYGFCIFSRIIKEKGINDAINSIKRLNNEGFKCLLDIYGPIDQQYRNEFEELISNVDFVNYKGCANPNDSKEILSKYSFLLFPTHYEKEGLPGTIIDAYYANTVIIASNWKSASEFIPDDVGFIYDFANEEKLYETIKYCLLNSDIVEEKRNKIRSFLKKFEPKVAIEPLVSFIREQ